VVRRRLEDLEKKQRKKQRKVSEAQRMLCEWTVMITDLLDAERYTAEQLWVLYRVRWQVEMSHPDYPSSEGLYRRDRAA
jgi:hypothetical protein